MSFSSGSVTVRTVSRAEPVVIDPQHPAIRAASLAYRKGFGAAPVFLRSGGTIPILSTFQKALGLPTVLMGFALPDDRMHAPNEKFHIPNFFKGIETSIWFMDALASAPGLHFCASPRSGRDAAGKQAGALQ